MNNAAYVDMVDDGVGRLPEGAADLVFVCTPPAANEQLIRDMAARGVRAVFMAAGICAERESEGSEQQGCRREKFLQIAHFHSFRSCGG